MSQTMFDELIPDLDLAFVVWHRVNKRERWKPVLSADSEEAAVEQALALHLGGDWLVRANGKDPNNDRRPSR